jgi:hypothetical protein
MSQYDKLMRGALTNPEPQPFELSAASYEQVMNAMNNPNELGWGVVALVSVVGGAVLAIPDPVPGSGLVAFGMIVATWWAKLNSYGVQGKDPS